MPLVKINSFPEFLQKKQQLQRTLKLSKQAVVDHINKEINQKYDFLKEQTVRIESMCQDFDDLLEYHKVIESSQQMLAGEMFREIRDRIEVMSDRDHLSERQSIDHEEAKHLISNAQLSESSFEIHNDDSVNVGKIIGT